MTQPYIYTQTVDSTTPTQTPVKIICKRKFHGESQYSIKVEFTNGKRQYIPLELIYNLPNPRTIPKGW